MKEPMLYVNIWRFLNIVVLIHLWMLIESTDCTFTLILLLLMMMSLRWRFSLPIWTVVFDLFFCFLYFPYATISYFGLALPLFEFILKGKWLVSVLLFLSVFFLPVPSTLFFWYLLQASFLGIFSFFMLKNQHTFRLEVDRQRKSRYELERIKIDLLEANKNATHQAELMERNRISRQLHDHLGHDLTGAVLALQAHEYVQDTKEAEKLLEEVKKRLERSTKNLRETVHNMTPTTLIGVENLEYIVENFRQMNIQFQKSGNLLCVPAHKWGLLEACLKEALTNVARHSDATKVDVDLHVTDSIVRLSVQDNGTAIKNHHSGSGLRSLQMRTRSLGGSLSIGNETGFLLVCVIPLEKEAVDETINRGR